jgi:multidrug efflux system outer membrane protein
MVNFERRMRSFAAAVARRRGLLPGAISLLLLAACSVGPDYVPPAAASIPPSYGWKIAEPGDDKIKGNSWTLFGDPVLDDFEARATAANQSLKAAVARVDTSRAAARIEASQFFPQISFEPSTTRFRTPPTVEPPLFTATTYTLPLDLSYEIDIWGRVRRSFESARAEAQASVADYETILLSLQGDVAVDYFLLRQLDVQIDILKRTVVLRKKAVDILQERVRGGLSSIDDEDRAETELELTRTQTSEAERQRADLQDALALLCGEAAPAFRIPPGPLVGNIPGIPLGLPSQLLERRPDIAAAERRMAAANARIGVAYAAFFPALSLTGQAGYSSFDASTLLSWQSRLFQIGPEVVLPILTGGRTEAQVKQARGDYNRTCAEYQQTVLVGFREVTDALNDLQSYREQAVALGRAVAAAHRTTGTSTQDFTQGLVNYLNVVDADRVELQAETEAAQIDALERVATVHLIKALGGGFEVAAR